MRTRTHLKPTRSHCKATTLLVVLAMCVGTSTVAFAQDKNAEKANNWESYRNGFQLLGTTNARLPEKLEVLWTIPTEFGVTSTAAIVGDRVYVPTLGGEVLCVELRTGKTLWKTRSIDDPDPAAFAPGFKSSPTVWEGVIYLGDEDGMFHAIDAETGKRKWQFKTNGEIISSASIVGEKVIFGSYDNSLYCLNRKTGEKLWSFETDGYVNCSPAISTEHTFVTGCDEHLRVINLETGEEEIDMPLGSYLIASPALRDGILYVGTYASSVVAIDWKTKKTLWSYRDEDREFPYHSSAAVTDDMVIIGGRDKQIHAIDRKTGRGIWTFGTRKRVDSSPVVAGDRVFCGSSDGFLYELNRKTGQELQRYKIGREVTASPAIGQNCLIIAAEGSNEPIICLGKKMKP
ncbi:beta-alanine-activating enzyme beta-propeller domain-containing protein [Thalassoroseus pseudoceratinae]|uniref:beta-alanine-activating enzyme beta-propeller domain-containing protein n=1 Tax=Thalassoroseus pseudoceratinae TaxID=2713176 RepID=UPI00141F24EF|nr:PQQ-binding-like beta-propeller repeat protein [Thalassoroseus pseudoceratinae]